MDDIAPLEPQLAARRESARERLPQLFTLIERLVADLERNTVANALNTGQEVPDFTLPRADTGENVTLSAQLERGPAVLSFYRGKW